MDQLLGGIRALGQRIQSLAQQTTPLPHRLRWWRRLACCFVAARTQRSKQKAERMLPERLHAANEEERFVEKLANVANIILGGGGVVSFLAFLYFFYHYSWTGDRKFAGSMGVVLHYVVPAVVAGLLFASLKLKASYRINLAIFSVSLAASVLAVELFLQLSNVSAPKQAIWQLEGHSKEQKQRTKEYARRYGIDFDTRDPIEVLSYLRKGGVDAVPMVSKWLDKRNDLWSWRPDGSIQSIINIAGEEVIPLGAVANRLTVLCNESGQWITYPSDEHGFNNPRGIWGSDRLDIAALGDSFAQGYCVPADKSLVALIRQRFAATLNLAIAGNGPLLELATLKEYLPSLKPKHVLWFYFEGNDLTGLQIEKQSSLLMRYLKDDFNQGLAGRQRDIDQALIGYIDRQMARKMNEPPPQRRNWISKEMRGLGRLFTLSSLRQELEAIQQRTLEKAELADLDGPTMDLFGQILVEAKRCVDAWGGTLDFVYLPSATRYFGPAEIPVRMRARVLSAVDAFGIPVIDIHPVFQAHGDVRSFFPWGGYGHYNERGHRIVADEVLRALDGSVMVHRDSKWQRPMATES